ncbi:uncharacterized protein LOC127119273 [Lathyrus oleraceus]|uniref:uncharacterized protein LOC127119273 n=1 Tax=Pisum sativum TaxID=3888 RepID=UPI001FC4D269|nr:uncharacterized protein LOC127119273 [Pisum sativum]
MNNLLPKKILWNMMKVVRYMLSAGCFGLHCRFGFVCSFWLWLASPSAPAGACCCNGVVVAVGLCSVWLQLDVVYAWLFRFVLNWKFALRLDCVCGLYQLVLCCSLWFVLQLMQLSFKFVFCPVAILLYYLKPHLGLG